MSKSHKRLILIDLDGVLNDYVGNYDKHEIPQIKDGAVEFVKKLSSKYDLKLFTTRDKNLAHKWLYDSGIDKYFLGVTNFKEACYLIVDDRCVVYNGDYVKTYDLIESFNVWWKQV